MNTLSNAWRNEAMRVIPDRRPLIAPSFLSCDFSRIGEEVRDMDAAGADLLHLDVMDGRFVPNITFGPVVVNAVRRQTETLLDVHLMIVEPERYFDSFHGAGADILTVHWEASPHLHRSVQAIRALGMRAGVSINPATPVSVLRDILEYIDLVLIMSVNPGFGGQEFILRSLDRVSELKQMADGMHRSDLIIEVDGGVCLENAGALVAAGANALVSGSALFRSGDYPGYISGLRGG